jgi:NADPH-dependent curcumin reductase CurA
MKVKKIVLASRPAGMPDISNFRTEETILPELKDDEVVLSPLYISVDPYMRGRMNDQKSYMPPFELNKPIEGSVVAEIVESKSKQLNKGDKVLGFLPWATRAVEKGEKLTKLENPEFPDYYYLGVLGFTGLTAYVGVMKICEPKAGQTFVVSGAAGAVGSIAGQIAKMQGCRVVGIAGSDEKAQLLKTKFGFDEVINYKTAGDLTKAIADACPDGVDHYFDNVGGDISDAVIANINPFARIALCGQIALYNNETASAGPRLLPQLLTQRAQVKGFLITDYQHVFAEGQAYLLKGLREGKIQHTDTIADGFDKLPEAFLGLFSGYNTGKMLVKV